MVSPWQPEKDPIRKASLGKLNEECGELIAILSRCLIQGIDEAEPVTGKSNRLALEEEIADVRAGIIVVSELLGLREGPIWARVIAKMQHYRQWWALIER